MAAVFRYSLLILIKKLSKIANDGISKLGVFHAIVDLVGRVFRLLWDFLENGV